MGDTNADAKLPDERIAELRADPEACFEFLVAEDVLEELDDGTVTVTQSFESDRGIYVDTYGDSSDEQFRETVAELFGLDHDEAGRRIEELELTRWEIATYLTLRGSLDVDVPEDVLLELADMTAAAGPASPVPADMTELFDDDWERFIETEGDAVLFVFQHGCSPCEMMKEGMSAIRATAPDDVAFAGLNGDEVIEFRREFDVTVAPTTLVFADGDLVEAKEGFQGPEDLADVFADAYPAADH